MRDINSSYSIGREKLNEISLQTNKEIVVTNKKFVIAFDSIMDVPNVFIDGKDVSVVGGNNLGIHDVLIQWNTDTASGAGEKVLFIKNFVKDSDDGGVIEKTVKEASMKYKEKTESIEKA